VNEKEKEYGKLGALIIESLEEALKHARGEEARVRVLPPVEVTTARKAYVERPPCYPPYLVREIRQKLGVSQAIFAQMLGVSASTVRAWEQGKREAEGPVGRILQLAEMHPEIFKAICGLIHPATGGKRRAPRTLRAPAAAEKRLAADNELRG
jgi:putative transcriptional regulator